MSPIGYALLVVLTILIISGVYWINKRRKDLQGSITNWAKQLDPNCDNPADYPVACAPLVDGTLYPPPLARVRPLSGPPLFDAPTAAYAVRLVARFIAFIKTKDTSLTDMVKMAPPILSFNKNDNTMPLAATWQSLDGYSAVIAIRGTKTVEDFLLDLKYHEVRPSTRQIMLNRPATPYLGREKVIQVHGGMYSAYLSIRDSLFAALPNSAGMVFITGHSMGAAIAYYYALELAITYPNISVRVIGLAPPRAGDAAFAADLSIVANCTSIINVADFVPSMPWSYMPDVTPPYSTDEYAHVSPIFSFNNRKADITACHGVLAYLEGVTNGVEPALIPTLQMY